MKYRPEIDGLRAVAVLSVIFFHAGFPKFRGGFVGVDVFFVISGYLITTIILSEMEAERFSLANFYERRARRILPPLFLVMLAIFPFSWYLLMPTEMIDFSESIAAVALFSSNILFWQESSYWNTANELKPLLHTWSLAIEEQYYVLFPLFLMIMWRFGKRKILAVFFSATLISFAFALWLVYRSPDAAFYLLPARGWELAIGASIAFYLLYKKNTIRQITSHKALDELFGFLGIVMIGYSIVMFNKKTLFPSHYTLIPTLGTAFVIIFTTSGTIIGRFLSSKPMVTTGLMSYSAYLWHQPILAVTHYLIFPKPAKILLLAPICVTFLFAYLSWKFIEKPFRDKDLFNRKKFLFLPSPVRFYL
jgi:peptidoglycan/LPS O-acetylase OafA/YrhL